MKKNSVEEDELFPVLIIAKEPFSNKYLISFNFVGSVI